MTAPAALRLSDIVPTVAAAAGLDAREVGERLGEAVGLEPDPRPDEVWAAEVLAPAPRRPGMTTAQELAGYFFGPAESAFRSGYTPREVAAPVRLHEGGRASAHATWVAYRLVTYWLTAAGLPDPWAGTAEPPAVAGAALAAELSPPPPPASALAAAAVAEWPGWPNPPKKRDEWVEPLTALAQDVWHTHGRWVPPAEAWRRFRTVPPDGYGITATTDRGEEAVTRGGKALSRSAFEKRWQNWSKPRPAR